MKKRDELTSPTSCLNKAKPDEPVFVLRGKDALGPQAVRHWATMAEGVHEPAKIAEALRLADEMEAWRSNFLNPPPEAA